MLAGIRAETGYASCALQRLDLELALHTRTSSVFLHYWNPEHLECTWQLIPVQHFSEERESGSEVQNLPPHRSRGAREENAEENGVWSSMDYPRRTWACSKSGI